MKLSVQESLANIKALQDKITTHPACLDLSFTTGHSKGEGRYTITFPDSVPFISSITGNHYLAEAVRFSYNSHYYSLYKSKTAVLLKIESLLEPVWRAMNPVLYPDQSIVTL